MNPYKPQYPPQENIPSQDLPKRVPYSPDFQADASQLARVQESHPPGVGGPPPAYVVSTFDARPIRAVDFSTYSGSDPRDTGFDGLGGAYITSSIFYEVQPGRVAIVRDWQILLAPESGQNLGDSNPIFNPNGTSNFRVSLSFLVNGQFQEGVSGRVMWNAAFGDVFGECYILAQPGDVIEMRLSTNGDFNDTSWNQALMMMHGNLLSQRGGQIDYEPASIAALPVHETGVEPVYSAGDNLADREG